MNRLLAAALLPLSLCLSAPLAAQDAPAPEDAAMAEAYQKAGMPGPAHAGLALTAGDYAIVSKSWAGPGATPAVETGTATRRLILGGRVVVEEMHSQQDGRPFEGFGLTGFDNATGKYWITWNDTLGTGLMTGEGDCDATARCAIAAHWIDPVSKQPVDARIAIRWESPAVEVFEMFVPSPDGAEMKMLEITYTRK